MNNTISIQKVERSGISSVDFKNIPFGRHFTDHMFVADYYDDQWHDLKIVPFGNMSVHPATTALHYGQAIFEGMKAYKTETGVVQVFRPTMNAQRFNVSAERMAMPTIPEELFLDALEQFLQIDSQWIPTMDGSSLYIRPYMFATDEYLGIKAADKFRFVIFASPVGPYYPRPVKVLVADRYVRAFRGGVGNVKAAGNYAATLKAVKEANEKGYDQILWMDGVEFKYIHEIGTMNVFFVMDGKVITPTLEEDTILHGITRDSVITLLKEKNIPVEERSLSIDEVHQAFLEEKLEDAFGTGTAATISQISDIGYLGDNMELPVVENRNVSNMLKRELKDIKLGRISDHHNWMTQVELPIEMLG